MRAAWTILWGTLLGACSVLGSGLDLPVSSPDAAPDATVDGRRPGADRSLPKEGGLELSGDQGDPALVGCSDGTREGFLRIDIWPRLAACSGGFFHSGVVGPEGQTVRCNREAGNSSENPKGLRCGVADLCAEGWHLCKTAREVALYSPTGDCEGCVPDGDTRFFLVGMGASPQGICSSDPLAANDLHGCGGRGQPESAACAPLIRRMAFHDCQASGVWDCGSEAHALAEANVVLKSGPEHGGALCCKDSI